MLPSTLTENSEINLQSLITSLQMRMKHQVKGHMSRSVVISLNEIISTKAQSPSFIRAFCRLLHFLLSYDSSCEATVAR